MATEYVTYSVKFFTHAHTHTYIYIYIKKIYMVLGAEEPVYCYNSLSLSKFERHQPNGQG